MQAERESDRVQEKEREDEDGNFGLESDEYACASLPRLK